MPSNTSRLNLLKKDPIADGNDTFNIQTMLNENWDKVDQSVALIDPVTGKLIPGQENTPDVSGLATKEELNEHKQDNTSHVHYGVASGTNAKTVTLDPVPTTLGEGFALAFKNTTANTGAVTLNVNSLGAKSIIKSGGASLSSGGLKAGGVYTVRYDGTSFILQGEGSSGDALASDLLSGKTASTDAGDIVGTMPNRGTFNLALGATVPAGYYSGGNVPTGKGFATGTQATIGSISITGLTFRPRIVILRATSADGSILARNHTPLDYTSMNSTMFQAYNNANNATANGRYNGFSITNDGFSCSLTGFYSSSLLTWEAYE